jgi:SAM-dependent methyltransferase
MKAALDKNYWDSRYQEGTTGWDLGEVSPALKAYIDQLENKDLKILIPGGGNAYELAYLHQQGFTNSYLIDLSPTALANFKKKNPSIDEKYLIEGNYFDHQEQYDLILEQTFFCAIDRTLRAKYAEKTYQLLQPNGKLVGLLWSDDFGVDAPPFGGTKEEYLGYFDSLFTIQTMSESYNSIKPRASRELFIILQK